MGGDVVEGVGDGAMVEGFDVGEGVDELQARARRILPVASP